MKKKYGSKKLLSILAVAAIFLIFLLFPVVMQNRYYQSVLNQAIINIIIVLGLNFITGLTGQTNLGTAGIYCIGAYAVGILSTKLSISPWVCLLTAIACGCLIGGALGYPSLRVKGLYLALTTIGFSEIVRLLVMNLNDLTGGVNGIRSIPSLSVFGYVLDTQVKFYYFMLAVAVLLTFVAVSIVYSKWGRVFKAIRDNPQAAEACGIKISTLQIQAFTLAAIYGSIAGALYAMMVGFISPASFTTDVSINYVAMLMIGGIGSVAGNILGAVTMTILPEMLKVFQDYYWLVFSIIGLVFAVALPNGLISIINAGVNKTADFAKKFVRGGR